MRVACWRQSSASHFNLLCNPSRRARLAYSVARAAARFRGRRFHYLCRHVAEHLNQVLDLRSLNAPLVTNRSDEELNCKDSSVLDSPRLESSRARVSALSRQRLSLVALLPRNMEKIVRLLRKTQRGPMHTSYETLPLAPLKTSLAFASIARAEDLKVGGSRPQILLVLPQPKVLAGGGGGDNHSLPADSEA